MSASRRPVFVEWLLMAAATAAVVASAVLHEPDGSHPPRVQALFLGGMGLWALEMTLEARRKRSAANLVTAGLFLLLGVSGVFASAPLSEQPAWLVGLRAGAGAVLVVVMVVATVAWRRERDERERAILNAATAIAFLATMTFVLGFGLVADASTGIRFTPGWIVAAAVAAWLLSFNVLQRRM